MQHWELSVVLCDDLEGWDGGGEVHEGGDRCRHTAIHTAVQQKLTQPHKAIVLQKLYLDACNKLVNVDK